MNSQEEELNKTLAGKKKPIEGLSNQGDEITDNEKETVPATETNTNSSLKPSTEVLISEDSREKQSRATPPKTPLSEENTSGYKLKSISDGNTINTTTNSEQSLPFVKTKESRTTPLEASHKLEKVPPHESVSMEQMRVLDTTEPKELASASETIVESQTVAPVPNKPKDQPPDPSKELENELKSQAVTRKPIGIKRVKIHFIPVGIAPQMKQRRFQISGNGQFSTLQEKLRKMLQLTSSQLFLYINESFVPSPDDLIGDLGDLFSVRGAKGELELKVNYSLQEAWG